MGESSFEIHPHCGVLQGSPISTILFLIYIDYLLHRIVRVQLVSRNAFSDDLILWLAGSFHDRIIHPSLQRALGLMERWAIFWVFNLVFRSVSAFVFARKMCTLIRSLMHVFMGNSFHMSQSFSALVCSLMGC